MAHKLANSNYSILKSGKLNKENSLSEFHYTLLKTIPFGLQIVDTTGKILYSNERMQDIIKGNITGSRCWEIYKVDKKQCRDCPLKGEIKKGETLVTEVNNIVNGGTFLIHHNRMIFNGEDALLEIFQDITERKSSEESIKKISSKLVEQNRNLEQFAYIISHNLRTPVANITGIAHILEEYETNPDEKDEMLKLLFSSVKMLDEIIHDLNNILEVKKEINEKKEKIYFSELLNDVLKIIEGVIKKEGALIKSNFKEADEVITLKSYMHSIFYNLITNGIKYRRENIRPVIEIESRRKNNKIELIFKDNGIGIDLINRKDVVFGLYKRFHTHVEGKGMGLFMTKMQVESLGGKISVNSEVNKGTEFKIEFDV